ncbi:MAG TPA: ATPase domain-containing protein [Aggregatilineaceae bacterium]|nr:ATPase domain-containing protein [Aggregatilineaceae bacterium]
MSDKNRLSSGVAGLDEMLGGGFVPQSAILVRGAPGTGKTTFGLQYLLDGVRRNEPGLFITFEEFPQSLYRDAASVGWNLPEIEQEGKLHLLFTSPAVLLKSLATPESNILRGIQEFGIQRVVVDSLTHFTQSIRNPQELRQVYHQVISALRREGTTAMYLAEEMRSDYSMQEKGRLSFVVDNIVILRYLEIDSAIQRAVVVLKMRSSAHDNSIHSYTIGANGIRVGKRLEGKSGLLSGLITRNIISPVQ